MKTTETLIVHPESQDKFDALKAFLKALKIKFKISKEEKPYNPKFVEKILQGDKDFAQGKGKKITLEELNKLWK